MLEEIGVTPDHKRIGYYAGIIESLFAISQLCTVFLWGRLSDRIGRKPVLITGLSGLMVGVTAFGLQRHFVGLVISRAFAGFMNGKSTLLQRNFGAQSRPQGTLRSSSLSLPRSPTKRTKRGESPEIFAFRAHLMSLKRLCLAAAVLRHRPHHRTCPWGLPQQTC